MLGTYDTMALNQKPKIYPNLARICPLKVVQSFLSITVLRLKINKIEDFIMVPILTFTPKF